MTPYIKCKHSVILAHFLHKFYHTSCFSCTKDVHLLYTDYIRHISVKENKMAKDAYFLSIDCMKDESASPLDKLIYAVLSTDSHELDKTTRRSTGMGPMKIASIVSSVTDLRTIKKAISNLIARNVIEEEANGYLIRPWGYIPATPKIEDTIPPCEVSDNILDKYSSIEDVFQSLKIGEIPGLRKSMIDQVTITGKLSGSDIDRLRGILNCVIKEKGDMLRDNFIYTLKDIECARENSKSSKRV